MTIKNLNSQNHNNDNNDEYSQYRTVEKKPKPKDWVEAIAKVLLVGFVIVVIAPALAGILLFMACVGALSLPGC